MCLSVHFPLPFPFLELMGAVWLKRYIWCTRNGENSDCACGSQAAEEDGGVWGESSVCPV